MEKVLSYLKQLNYIDVNDNGNKFNLDDLYIELQKHKDLKVNETVNIHLHNYLITVTKFNTIVYNITIYKSSIKKKDPLKELEILIEPLTILFYNKYITISSLDQFNKLVVIPDYEKYVFYCGFHREEFDMAFGDLINHCKENKTNCTFVLNKRVIIKYKKYENDFNSIFIKKKNASIFENHESFEKNYSKYFDFDNYQDKDMTFEFYDDANHKRFLMIKNLCSETNILGSLIIYYGLPGMGKSITLIKTFKYEYNHKIFGTLYINCKYFFKSYMNDFNQMKNTLKDEIAYLFQDEFKEYEKCIEWIDKINKDINKNFWNIIIYIIKTYCVNKSKKYIYIYSINIKMN